VAATVFGPGNHGSTFGGNPLVCAAANAVLDALDQEQLMPRAAAVGTRMLEALRNRLAGNNRVRDVRGLGLMLGIELAEPCGELVAAGLDAGILINVTRDNVIRLLPPLTVSDEEADLIVEKVVSLVEA
jgi:acetylornithine aminotransferase